MKRHALGIAVLEQLYGDTPDQAEQRLKDWLAQGFEMSGPPFENGVAKGEVVTVNVSPPDGDAGDADQVQARAKDLTTLAGDERQRLNDETNRRFWKKVGDDAHHKLGRGGDQRAERELWMHTRDEVLQERQRVLDLPDQLREFLGDDQEINPDRYQASLRIADEAKGFTDADWARYERNVGDVSSDYSVVEESVKRFAAKRASDQQIIDRVKGTEELFALWHLDEKPGSYWGKGTPWRRDRAAKLLANSAFKDRAEYDAACDAYLRIVRDRAVEITLLALRASRLVVNAELTRYRSDDEVRALFEKQAKLRPLIEKQRAADIDLVTRRARLPLGDPKAWWDEVAAAKERAAAAEAAVGVERADEARTRPILKDEELSSRRLDVPTAGALGEVLRSDAEDRVHEIDKTFARVVNDPDAVFQFDRILPLALRELGADARPDKTIKQSLDGLDVDTASFGSIGQMIVHEHVKDLNDHSLRNMAMFIATIGLVLLTFGTGSIAVIAAGALLAQGVYQAGEDVKAYGDAYAAAHTAFDSDDTVSSDSPSAFWAAFSLISAGLSGIPLAHALEAAGKSLQILERAGTFKQFDAELLKAIEDLPPDLKAALTPSVKAVLKRALRAKARLDEATRLLRRAMKDADALGAGAGSAKIAAAVSKCGYLGAQLGMNDFSEFLAFLKSGHLRPLDLATLGGEELAAVQGAWESGVTRANKAGVAIKGTLGVPTENVTQPAPPASGEPTPAAKDTPRPNEPAATEEKTATADEGQPLAIEELVLGYATKEEVRAAVKAALSAVKGRLPKRWDLVKAALRATDGKVNREILGLLDSYMAALRDPGGWADVLADAWELAAAMPNPNMRDALIELAKRRGLGATKTVPDILEGSEFFDDYVASGQPLIDLKFRGKPHAELTHLIQDLVLDGAFGPGASARFRILLGKAEGTVERFLPGEPGRLSQFGEHRGPSANVTFLEDESKMKTGDYVWRFTYDLLYNPVKLRRLPQPEAAGPILSGLLGLE
ncbi:MAG: hypothetical protein ACJ780_23645 [Solirubrobacteraceae bacterium]